MKTARATTSRMKIYGDVGIVAYDQIEDKLQCHLCGKWRRSLSQHVVQAHGWSAEDYRQEFGLNRQQALICEGTREIEPFSKQKLLLKKEWLDEGKT